MLNLSLRYEDNGTLHDDIQLQLENETWTCDSYYFALDRNVQEDDESTTKVKAVLSKLLEQWLTVATDLPDAGTAFLPFDFSDQCTAWVRCQRLGDEMVLSLVSCGRLVYFPVRNRSPPFGASRLRVQDIRVQIKQRRSASGN
jgi:hypothetical protein